MATKTATKKASAKPVKKPAPKTAKEITKAVIKPTAQAAKKESAAKLPPKVKETKPAAAKEMKLGKVAKAKKPELNPVKRPIEEVKSFEKKESPRAPVKPPVTAIFSNKVVRKESTQAAMDVVREKMAQAVVRAINSPDTARVEEESDLEQTVTVMDKVDTRRVASTKKREVAEGRVSFEEVMQAASSQTSNKPFFDAESYLRK